jgi:RNA polymerase sigma-70 factor (ECF subfamily)
VDADDTPIPVADRDAQGARWRMLMATSQGGDGAAYRLLLVEVTPWIRASARAMLRDAAEAEDAVQDALLTLHQVRHTYDPTRPFKPWLATVAKRRILDRMDGARRRLSRHAPVEAAENVASETFSAHGPNTQEQGLRADELRAAIAKLPKGQRQALELLKLQEKSLAEAAAETGLSITALKVATHRAMISLRKLMTRTP